MCKKIQAYVDRYIKVRGTAFLFGRQEGLENKVIEMIQLPKHGFIVLDKPVLSFPFGSNHYNKNSRPFVSKFTLLQLEKICERRIEKVVYRVLGENIVCYIYKDQKGLIYRYDLEKGNWEIFLYICALKNPLDPDKYSHECTTKQVPPMLVSAFSTNLLFIRSRSLFLIPNNMLEISHRNERFEDVLPFRYF